MRPLTVLYFSIEQSSNLQQEITNRLKNLDQAESDIICSGGQVGRQFGALGGARFAPFECQFGTRTLSIEADNQVILPDSTTFPLEELPSRQPLPEQMSLSYCLKFWQWD